MAYLKPKNVRPYTKYKKMSDPIPNIKNVFFCELIQEYPNAIFCFSIYKSRLPLIHTNI